MAKVLAVRTGTIAFLVSVIEGLVDNHGFTSTVSSALVVLVAFYSLGWIAGELSRHTVEQAARDEFARILAAADQKQQEPSVA